jgi:DegV family protein with EDD domain
MPRTCILTDSTVHFPKRFYPGHEHVYVIPYQVQTGEQLVRDSKDLGFFKSPLCVVDHNYSQAQPPSIEAFREIFDSLGSKYQEIVAILISSFLSPVVTNAHQAAESLKSRFPIHIIDSQTTAAGQGLLVQAAAEAAQRSLSAIEINHLVRGLIRHIYAVFCLPDLIYLSRSGLVDRAQGLVGEMLGIIPFFVMENGRLVHMQKIRSSRHMVDIMYEFVTEFEGLRYLALIQGIPAFEQEYHNLYERVHQNLRATHISEHTLSLALASILGPHCIGLVAMPSAAI